MTQFFIFVSVFLTFFTGVPVKKSQINCFDVINGMAQIEVSNKNINQLPLNLVIKNMDVGCFHLTTETISINYFANTYTVTIKNWEDKIIFQKSFIPAQLIQNQYWKFLEKCKMAFQNQKLTTIKNELPHTTTFRSLSLSNGMEIKNLENNEFYYSFKAALQFYAK